MKTKANEIFLAQRISSCSAVADALIDAKHPCHKVVNEQTKLIDVEIKRQRPEPWMGAIANADLLFVSSNPSINEDPYPLGEVFPTYEWRESDAADFFVNRLDQESEKVKVTFGSKDEPNFLTLCHDGQYRSGVSNSKRPQPTWKNTHDRAVELLGPTAHPDMNYAITEIVHCKSKDAKGVKEASSFCIEKWMEEIFRISPAKVVVLLGSKVRDFYALPILETNKDLGLFKDYSRLSQQERAKRDIFVAKVGGQKRLFVFNWHPTARTCLRILEKVYGEEVLSWLQKVVSGENLIPSAEELPNIIDDLFIKENKA